MIVNKCKEINCVDRLSKVDFVKSMALLNQQSTTATSLLIYTRYIRYEKNYDIQIDTLKSLYNVNASSVSNKEDFLNVINKIRTFPTNLPLEFVDEYFTLITNQFINVNMELDVSIESLFTDIEELFQFEDFVQHPLLKDYINYICSIIELNNTNADKLINLVEENKEIQDNEVLYLIPIIYIANTCFLLGMSKDVIELKKRLLTCNNIIIDSTDTNYKDIENIVNNSYKFDINLQINIYFFSFEVNSYSKLYPKVTVFKLKDNRYLINP